MKKQCVDNFRLANILIIVQIKLHCKFIFLSTDKWGRAFGRRILYIGGKGYKHLKKYKHFMKYIDLKIK